MAAGTAVSWAASTVLTPAEDVSTGTPYTYVSIEGGEVGTSLQLITLAHWTMIPAGANRAVGVVTSVEVAPGDDVSQGSTLYTVDLKPVVVAQGEVPAFRAIGLGVSGPDVAQIQAMLAARGLYTGSIDGSAGDGTVRAIRAWQDGLGTSITGVIEVGDVIFLPTLPARVALDDEVISRGAIVGGGEAAVRTLSASPAFELPVTDSQALMMPEGTRVAITTPEGGEWAGYVASQTSDPDSGTVTVALGAEGGGAICGDQCAQVPVTGEAKLSSRVETVETVTGLVVPSAALVTEADGQIAVIDENGRRLPVSVIASARGMSVVEGVSEGVRVRVPAEGPG